MIGMFTDGMDALLKRISPRMASQPVANCGSGLKPLTDNNTLAERLNMSVTQSTMKIRTIGSDGSEINYYGIDNYDGSTSHVAIVRYEDSVEVYQLDPEHLLESLEQLTKYLVEFMEYNDQWLDIAVHGQIVIQPV